MAERAEVSPRRPRASQRWFCEECGAKGTVRYQRDADVYSVRNKLYDAHAQLSPVCSEDWGLNRVRVVA